MADEKFITTVEQVLTARDETGDAFDKVAEKQSQLAESTKKTAEATSGITEKIKETAKGFENATTLANEFGKMVGGEVSKAMGGLPPHLLAMKLALDACIAGAKEFYEWNKKISEEARNNTIAAELHMMDEGYEKIVTKMRNYREETMEFYRELKNEVAEMAKSYDLQKSAIEKQLSLEKELIEARKQYNIALAGDDKNKKREAESAADKEKNEAAKKAEANKLSLVFAEATMAKQKADEMDVEASAAEAEADKAEAAQRTFNKNLGKDKQFFSLQQKGLVEELKRARKWKERHGDAKIGKRTIKVDDDTGTVESIGTFDTVDPDEYEKELLEQISATDLSLTQLENRSLSGPLKVSAARRKATQLRQIQSGLRRASETGFEEYRVGTQTINAGTRTQEEIGRLRAETIRITSQNEAAATDRKDARKIVNDLPDTTQSEDSKWAHAAQFLARENKELKQMIAAIFADKEATLTEMNNFKKKLKEVETRNINP